MTTSIYLVVYELITGTFDSLLGLGLIFYGHKVMGINQFLISRGLLNTSPIFVGRLLHLLVPYVAQNRFFIETVFLVVGTTKLISSIGLIKNQVWANHLLTILVLLFFPFDAAALIIHFGVDKLFYLVMNTGVLLYLTELDPKGYLYHSLNYYNKDKRVHKPDHKS